MLNAGFTLSDRYQIVSQLGAGGMGEVYRAKDLRLGRDVAIKVLPEDLVNNPQAVSRFGREARSLAALSHPNILAIFDFATDHDVAYAVTELLKGQTLRAKLTSSKPSRNEKVEMAISIAEGLNAAHSAGVIHRDLKPENIFLTADGGIKILDFGLARRQIPSQETLRSAVQKFVAPNRIRFVEVTWNKILPALGCVV